jgi:lipoate---protein ligase
MESIGTKPYDLPDMALISGQSEKKVLVWRPEKTCVVLGAANHAETSLNVPAVLRDGIEVYKRPSGGQAVVLSPATVVISLVFRDSGLRPPKTYFPAVNQCIMDALNSQGVSGLSCRGISDISVGDKKILGSSIYRKRELLMYHAVLNVSEPVSTLTKYLLHPSREPDYRAGRSHSEFVSSLAQEGYAISSALLQEILTRELEQFHVRVVS